MASEIHAEIETWILNWSGSDDVRTLSRLIRFNVLRLCWVTCARPVAVAFG